MLTVLTVRIMTTVGTQGYLQHEKDQHKSSCWRLNFGSVAKRGGYTQWVECTCGYDAAVSAAWREEDKQARESEKRERRAAEERKTDWDYGKGVLATLRQEYDETGVVNMVTVDSLRAFCLARIHMIWELRDLARFLQETKQVDGGALEGDTLYHKCETLADIWKAGHAMAVASRPGPGKREREVVDSTRSDLKKCKESHGDLMLLAEMCQETK